MRLRNFQPMPAVNTGTWYMKLAGPVMWLVTLLSTLGLIGALGLSSFGAYFFLAVWGIVVAARADLCLALLFRSPALWLVPVMALASTLWSQAPQATLRAALELSLTIGVACLTAGMVRPRAFVSAVSVSLMFGAVACLLFGRYGVDGISETVVFLGIFGSKNTMAMFTSLLLIFSIAVLADRGQPIILRLLAVVASCLSVPLLQLAHSAGAILTTVESLVVMGAILALAHMRTRERLLVLTCGAVIAVPVLAIIMILVLDGGLGAAVAGFITMLGKDPTLTGRTVLWNIALNEIAKRPFLGVGYDGFWIQGNLLAEGIWRAFQIDNRMGFEFHDTYLEVAVELGWAGVAALAITFVVAVERVIRLALSHRSLPTACLATILFCLMMRSVGEVDTPYPFSIGTFLFFVIASYGADYARVRHGAAHEVLLHPRQMNRLLPQGGISEVNT